MHLVAPPTPGLVIRRDELDVTALIGQTTPVDPGHYRFEATAPGHTAHTVEVDITGVGKTVEVFAKVDGRALTGSIAAVLGAPSKRDDVETAPLMPSFQETTLRGATGTVDQPILPAPRRRRVLGLAVAAIGLVAIIVVYTMRPSAEPIEAAGAATENSPIQPVNVPPSDAAIDAPTLDAAVAMPSDVPVVAPVDAPVRTVPPRRKPATKPRPKPRPPADLGTSRF